MCQKSAPKAKPPVSHPEAILDECSDEDSSEGEDATQKPFSIANGQEQELEWGETPRDE